MYPRFRPLIVATVPLVLFVAAGKAQQTSPAPEPPADAHPGYTLKTTSQIVQLDVVVRDQKGALVRGLHAGDFTVTEDGAPQRIVSFDETAPPPPVKRAEQQIDSTAELDRREPDAPVTIIVLDELTAKFEDQYFARYSLDRYLKTRGDTLDQPTTLIARSVDRTMVLSDYTTSKKKIMDALNRHFAANDWRAANPNFNDEQVGAAFASLLQIAQATEGHPGHKNLIWIGRGLPTLQWGDMASEQMEQLRRAVTDCVELLRRARITLYAIDPAGVQAPLESTDVNGSTFLEDPFNQSVSFDTLARATGGASLHGRNDVDHLIRDAVDNGESFYTLAYHPSTPTSVDPTKFRTIKITLRDNRLTATNREGYYPGAEQPARAPFADAKGKLTQQTMFDLASASSGLMVFDGIALTLERDPHTPGEVRISFPASALGLRSADGKLKADVTLIALGFDKSGKLLAKDGRVVSLHLAELPDGQSESRTVHLTTPLNPALPIARLRVVVRSNANGRIGADNLFLVDRASLKDRSTGVKPH